MNELAEEQKPSIEPSTSPRAVVKQEELADSLPTTPHLESTSTLALPLSEPQKQIQSRKKNGNTPCDYCRKVRRACKWVENFQVCERCLKSGRVCTGPTRRTESSFEVARSTPRKQLATASIGPSSPESRWSSLHLSYSLTYHLVEKGLEHLSEGYVYDNFDYDRFCARFRASEGRLNQKDSVNETFALAQMFVGAQCTNHSAVLRSSYSGNWLDTFSKKECLPPTSDVGLSRGEPLIAITRRIIERVRQQRLEIDRASRAAELISVWLFIVAGMILERFEEERLMLLREIVKEGFSYLAGADAAHPVGDNFRGPFAELIIEEVQLSLLLSQTSSVSGEEYRSIVEPAETRKAAFDFQDRWINLSTPIFWHLEYVLAYSPTERTHSALDYCWETMEKVNMCINDCIKRILQDPRYRSDDARPRPNNCVTNLIVKDLNSYWLLRSCHNIVLQRENSKSSLLERSRKLWFDALFRSVQHLDVLYHCRRSSFGFYSHCTHLVHAARVCPRDILLQWAREHASHRERIIEGLRFVSYGSPDASRLIVLLESCRTQRQ